jgi:hypothetical protein
LHDLAEAVEKLPSILPEPSAALPLRATGTTGIAPKEDPQCMGAYRPLTKTGDGERVRMGLIEGERLETPPASVIPNPLPSKVVEGERGRLMAAEVRAGDRIRTGDVQFGKRASSCSESSETSYITAAYRIPPRIASRAGRCERVHGCVDVRKFRSSNRERGSPAEVLRQPLRLLKSW